MWHIWFRKQRPNTYYISRICSTMLFGWRRSKVLSRLIAFERACDASFNYRLHLALYRMVYVRISWWKFLILLNCYPFLLLERTVMPLCSTLSYTESFIWHPKDEASGLIQHRGTIVSMGRLARRNYVSMGRLAQRKAIEDSDKQL